MIEILFSGCSFFAGTGLPKEKGNYDQVCNVFCSEYFHDLYNITNIAKSGNSNLSIHLSVVQAMSQKHYDYVFVGWTTYPRYNYRLGFETYEFGIRKNLTSGAGRLVIAHQDHNSHIMKYSKKWFEDFGKKYSLLHQDPWEIVSLLEYIDVLTDLSDQLKTKIYFVNNLCPWDIDFFERKDNFLPNELTDYTQKLLDTITRDDNEIFKLYHMMHDAFDQAGGIKKQKWLNLYNSFFNMQVDCGSDHHPGIKSQNNFGKYLAQQLNNLQE